MIKQHYSIIQPGRADGGRRRLSRRTETAAGAVDIECRRGKNTAAAAAEEYRPGQEITVAGYARAYLQRRKLNEENERRLRQHMLACIGSCLLREIRSEQIERCLGAVSGSSSSNINKTWSVMYRFFQAAANDELIVRNPMDKVERPCGTRGRRRPLNTLEQQALRLALRESRQLAYGAEPRRDDLMFGLSYACGLRPGEVRALCWDQLFLEQQPFPYLRINRAVKTGTLEIGTPKTVAGEREVPIPEWFCAYLRQYRHSCLLHEPRPAAQDLIFPAADGQPLSECSYKRRWLSLRRRMEQAAARIQPDKLLQRCLIGQDLTPYYLRHTYRTNLMEAGVEAMAAGAWMGHDNSRFSDIGYAHLTQRILRQAVRAVNEFEQEGIFEPPSEEELSGC